ncbi:ligand-binding sensor domain-containing diguanylate cyclase [Inhella proteolytica]|uniref:diguanylate cyclase n=1 Tax=Inhella proteolytica TaxID=2795029 RepID=A0A931J6Y9_9BURK|nr:ligand-binding sensor domain-containing diguanylate cyclase [Inhella proteolytica]MBH9577477.1 diguanylate cyclase [Inhella proteolytica]
MRRLAWGLCLVLGLGLATATPSAAPASPGLPSALPEPLAEPHFESLSDAGAIPDGVVSAMALDPSGMVWVGTSVGLLRFDGHLFVPVSMAGLGRSGTGTTFVRTLMAARDGRIWVGTDGRLLGGYDPRTEQWQVFRHDPKDPGSLGGVVRTLAEDAQGRIWVGSNGGGLQVLEPGSTQFRRYGAAEGLPDPRVQKLAIGTDGTVWVGTWNGLVRLAPGATRLSPLTLHDGTELRLPGQVVHAIAPLADGSLWLGTQEGELWRVDLAQGRSRQLDERPGNLGAVQTLTAVRAQEVWVGRAAGVELRELASGRLLRALRPRASKPWGLAGADIRAILNDPAGLLWVAGYGTGLQRVNNLDQALWVRRADEEPASPLAEPDVRSLLALRDGSFWAGTNDRGIAILDAALRTVGGIAGGQQGLAPGRVTALAQGGDGRIWVGVESKVFEFTHTRVQAHAHELGRGRLRRLMVDREGNVWAGTQDGLFRRAATGGRFERVTHHDGRPLLGGVNAIVQAPDGKLWVGAEAGLFPIAVGGKGLGPIDYAAGAGLASQNVVGLLIGRSGELWVDTTAGLHRLRAWDGRTATLRYLGEQPGMGSEAFGANLLQDARGMLWTHRGIYDPMQQQARQLGVADGVDIGSAWFRAYTQAADGRMLFGGSRGILVVQPLAFQFTRFAPPVVATSLRIGSREVPLARLQPRLELSPEERSFSLEFAAMDLSDPARNRYRHRLQGVDADWVESRSRQRQASYGGLAPGRYILEVQGSNRHGEWSPKLLRVEVQVKPAWWQAWWGRGFIVLSLLGLGWGVAQWRTRRLRLRQKELQEQVAIATHALEARSKALEQSALTDALTGLHNRRFVLQRLDDDQRLARRIAEQALLQGRTPPAAADLSFLMLDIDHFKRINDERGHAAGDAVLAQIRPRLMKVFSTSDYLVRWGGEEFLVVVRGTSRESLADLAEQACHVMADEPFVIPNGEPLNVTCSIGFACYPLDPSAPREAPWSAVLAVADAALYAAKREGRNRWVGVVQGRGTPFAIAQSLSGELECEARVVRGSPPAESATAG